MNKSKLEEQIMKILDMYFADKAAEKILDLVLSDLSKEIEGMKGKQKVYADTPKVNRERLGWYDAGWNAALGAVLGILDLAQKREEER